MMKRVIVEGPDGSGKSTLIASLMARFPQLELFPSYKHVEQDLTIEQYIDLGLSPDGPVYPRLHDRFFYSELIYGPILRGKISISPQKVRTVRSLLGDTAFLIYCRLPYEELVKRAQINEQKQGVLENLSRIYHDYDTIIGDNSSRFWTRNAYSMYDQTTAALDDTVKLLEGYLGD